MHNTYYKTHKYSEARPSLSSDHVLTKTIVALAFNAVLATASYAVSLKIAYTYDPSLRPR